MRKLIYCIAALTAGYAVAASADGVKVSEAQRPCPQWWRMQSLEYLSIGACTAFLHLLQRVATSSIRAIPNIIGDVFRIRLKHS